MNILKVLLNALGFNSNPIGVVVQLLVSLEGGRLAGEIQQALSKRISVAGRATIADQLDAISAAIRKGDMSTAALDITGLIQGIR